MERIQTQRRAEGVGEAVFRRPSLHLRILLLVAFIVVPLYFSSNVDAQQGTTEDRSLLQINLDLKDKKEQIDELREREKEYEEAIAKRQTEAESLESQLGLLEESIAKTRTQVERTNLDIERLTLEIELLEAQIAQKELEIDRQQGSIGSLIRELNRLDQKSLLEITIANHTLSDYVAQVRYLERVERETKDTLDELTALRADLEAKRQDMNGKREEQQHRRSELEGQQLTMQGEQDQKLFLLEETKESEELYQELITELKQEQSSINATIASLQNRLSEFSDDERFDLNLDIGELRWPVSPDHGISAYFHDPTYPYRRIFEHPAIDIPTVQGTPINAAEQGVVLIARNAGLGYSYIMIAHNDSLSTVYGHVSALYVSEGDFVERGDIIGLSGGQPGTPGAGYLTTGAHLHFEVRVDGIPVNPLEYLP